MEVLVAQQFIEEKYDRISIHANIVPNGVIETKFLIGMTFIFQTNDVYVGLNGLNQHKYFLPFSSK